MHRWTQSAAGGTSQRLKPGFAIDALAIEKAHCAPSSGIGWSIRHAFRPESRLPLILEHAECRTCQ